MGGEDTREAFGLPPEEILGKIFHFTAELGLRRFPHGFGELGKSYYRRALNGVRTNGQGACISPVNIWDAVLGPFSGKRIMDPYDRKERALERRSEIDRWDILSQR